MITIKFNTDNDAFVDCEGMESARIIVDLCKHLEFHSMKLSNHDYKTCKLLKMSLACVTVFVTVLRVNVVDYSFFRADFMFFADFTKSDVG